jgi:hypothetical protein
MEMRPYRAFGLVFIVNTRQAGEKYKVVIRNPDCTIFCAEGFETCVNSDTGEVMPDYEAGWFHTPNHNYIKGNFDLNVLQPSTVYCYDPKLNNGVQQKFGPVDVAVGDQITLTQGTKFLLCSGTLEVDGRTFNAPSRIRVDSEDKQLTATTRALGLILL